MSSVLTESVIVIGGGPVGATLALTLQTKGVPVTILEARAKGAAYQDQRALALSYGSRRILERLGVWQKLATKATAINTIHISQRGSMGRSLLKAQDHELPALGYVLSYGALTQALDEKLAEFSGVKIIYEAEATHIEPALENASVTFNHQSQVQDLVGKILVLADGGRSLGDIPGMSRETKVYGHDALVSKVKCELPHDNVAYERFTPMGPVALLPNGERDFSLVWTGKQAQVAEIMQLDDATFLSRLHEHFGDRVGRFMSVQKRLAFPLKLSYLNPVTAPHLVVIGNAAQTMHPVAGQGFNVGLRDAYELANTIAETKPADWGEVSMLEAYQKGRKNDTKRGLMFTDFLVNLFSNDVAGVSSMRGFGLGLFDLLGPIKSRVVNKMSFGSRG
jgi:2-octaprenyl-6-methoxyphenol hydroxylase